MDWAAIIGDPLKRLSLYQIVDKRGRRISFKLNWAQQKLYEDMWYCNVILKARQLGVSTFICLLFLDRCLFNSNMQAGIIAHTREDAEGMFKRVKLAYDLLPIEIKASCRATVDSARELSFSNGSSLRVGTSMRGSTLQYLHVSEFGKICAHYPEKAREIITGSLNTLADGQYIFIESTAEGRDGHFYNLCQQALSLSQQAKRLGKLDYKFHFFPWCGCPEYALDKTIAIPSEQKVYFDGLKERGIQLSLKQQGWYVAKQKTQGNDMLREYPSTPEEAFSTSLEGAYYSRQMARARGEGRVSRVPYDESLPVHTAWDLGWSDSTAIWWFQIVGKEIHMIDYFEGNLEPLTFYLKLVKDKPYSYGSHLAPHDITVHELSTGMSRMEVALKHGVRFAKVSDLSLDEGIDSVRMLLGRCWFDDLKCSKGIQCLDNYIRDWNKSNGCWSNKPKHNQASHGADAFRMLAVGLPLITGVEEMNDEKAEAMWRKESGYWKDYSIFG